MSTAMYKLKLERAEVIIGYHPRKPAEFYLWEALQVAGSGQNLIGGRRVYDGNKRLAIVGDAAMASAIAGPWYEQDDTLGAWDTKRQRLLSNANLARVAHETDLVGCMVVNPRNPVQASTKLAANLVEAVIGAVWLDSDESMSAVRQVMETLGLGLNGMVKLNPFSLL
ncbi:hypothetical protein D6D05_02025 [Aureobasidium pullulans]|nr:hypothetical protein D6D05_02025 [Aureobasidium pullulans]